MTIHYAVTFVSNRLEFRSYCRARLTRASIVDLAKELSFAQTFTFIPIQLAHTHLID
jgi:hypothetical protein